jgi:hypothetical protein
MASLANGKSGAASVDFAFVAAKNLELPELKHRWWQESRTASPRRTLSASPRCHARMHAPMTR